MSASDFNSQKEALWQSWLNLQAVAEEALQTGASHYFKCIRQAVCDKLAIDALTAARIGQCDERIYDHLVYLMETYQEVIRLFQGQIDGASPDLVTGLCEVLASRLNQFEDVAAGQGNPVAKEKHVILESAIIYTTQQIENLEKSYFSQFTQPPGADCSYTDNESMPQPDASPDPLIKMRKELLTNNTETQWQPLCDSIIDKTFPSLFTHYQESLHRCLSSIDDLHTRKTANFYTDLLEREWEVLGLIIRVQVQALEATGDADGTMHHILSKLREAYQQTGPVISNLRKMLQSAPDTPRTPHGMTCDLFTEALTHNLTAPPPANIDSQGFESALLPEADALFEGLRTGNFEMIYSLQCAAGDESTLAEGVIAIFEKAGHSLAALVEDSCAAETSVISDEESEMGTQAISDMDSTQEREIQTLGMSEPQEREIQTLGMSETQEREIQTPVMSEPQEQEPQTLGISEAQEKNTQTPDMLETQESHPQYSALSNIQEPGLHSPTPADAPTPEVLLSQPHEIPTHDIPHLEKEILSGITETLDIKVESLKESLQSFSESSAQLLTALSSEIPTLTENDLISAANHLMQAWCTSPPSIETVADFLAECTALAPFAAYNDRFTKLIANYTAKAEKASTRFKKETLLYEVSTYEEILYYSVSRLRESSVPQVEAAVRMLDETFHSLETLLTASGIAVIRPAPHESFNGREHEVLAAEEQEGFAKGEIIKVMTSGYKQNEAVILRANVIAAR